MRTDEDGDVVNGLINIFGFMLAVALVVAAIVGLA